MQEMAQNVISIFLEEYCITYDLIMNLKANVNNKKIDVPKMKITMGIILKTLGQFLLHSTEEAKTPLLKLVKKT